MYTLIEEVHQVCYKIYIGSFIARLKWKNLHFFTESFDWLTTNFIKAVSLIHYSQTPLQEKWKHQNIWLPTKFPAPEVDQYQLQHQHSFDKVACQAIKLSVKKCMFFHLVLPKKSKISVCFSVWDITKISQNHQLNKNSFSKDFWTGMFISYMFSYECHNYILTT